MSINIVHMSDFHFSPSNFESHLSRIDAAALKIENFANKGNLIVILVTGDIANTGKIDEYSYAQRYFKQLLNLLRKSGKRVNLYFVPGNHDCDFTSNDGRKTLVDKVKKSKSATDQEVQELISVQKNFENFVKENSSVTEELNPLVKRIFIESGDTILSINLINTSWISMKREDKSLLLLDRFMNLENTTSSHCEYIIPVYAFHHPSYWLESESDHFIRNHIEKENCLIFTGHEHMNDDYTKVRDGKYIHHDVSGEMDGKLDSSFSITSINCSVLIRKDFVWSKIKKSYVIESESNETINFRKEKVAVFTSEFSEFLDDIGILLTHPRKKHIALDDIFVAPYISQEIAFGKKESLIIESDESIETIVASKKSIIDGDYGYGKTTLSKVITKYLLDKKDCLPLYIDAKDIIDSCKSKVRLSNKIDELELQQYGKEAKSKSDGISIDRRYLVVDDYHLLMERDAILILFHEVLSSKFGNFIFFTNSSSSIVHSMKTQLLHKDFTRYSIEQFGPKLITDLVTKWNNLNNIELSLEQIKRKTEEKVQLIRNLVKQNTIPSTPGLILSVLSIGDSHQINQNTSIYGQLLRVLISMSMMKADIRNEDQYEIFRIVSIFAFRLYKNDERWSDYGAFDDIVTKYNYDYGLKVIASTLLSRLCQANILQIQGNIDFSRIQLDPNTKVSFRYGYLYSYFVAAYLNENLSQLAIQNEVSQLFDKIHLEDYSRIIINLWYFTKDDFLMKQLEDKVNSTLISEKPYEFENPALCFKKLAEQKKDIILSLKTFEGDIEERRQLKLKAEENLEHSERKDSHNYNLHEDKNESNEFIVEINTAHNIIATISQITKCYGGIIKKEEKKLLVESCYSLGMKVLSLLFGMLDDTNQFIEYVKDLMNQDSQLAVDNAYEKSIETVQMILHGAAYSTILRVSDSVASDKFVLALEEFKDKTKCIGTDLVYIASSYLFLKVEKSEFVISFIERINPDPFVFNLLRLIIWQYYYTNPERNAQDRNRLFAKLRFNPDDTKKTLLKSKNAK